MFENQTNEIDEIDEWLDWWLKEPRLNPENQKTFNNYYASYTKNFSPYLRNHYRNQTKEVSKIIRPGMKILEVGCGCGTETLFFAYKGAKVLGIDISVDRLKTAKNRKSVAEDHFDKKIDATFDNKNIFDFEGCKFDIIFMEQAFHHIEPRALLPEKIFSLLEPGGSLIISEANALNPLLQAVLFARRGFSTVVEYNDHNGEKHVYGNERITTAASLRKQFSQAGFLYEGHDYFRLMPNLKNIDFMLIVERVFPQFLSPAFTHFNIKFNKPLN